MWRAYPCSMLRRRELGGYRPKRREHGVYRPGLRKFVCSRLRQEFLRFRLRRRELGGSRLEKEPIGSRLV